MSGMRPTEPASRLRLPVICLAVFLVALGVRLLHLQDSRLAFDQPEQMMNALIRPYRQDAKRMVEEGGALLPGSPVEEGNTRLIVHPPGYSLLIAALFANRASDPSYVGLRVLQIVCDALSCVLLVLIAAELMPLVASAIAGLLAALSPHFAHYALWLSPDSLSVLPVMGGLYLIVRTVNRPHWATTLGGGLLFGLSCWLRANALLLAPFCAAALVLLLDRGVRLKHASLLVVAAVVAVAPITIRNWFVYHRVVPLTPTAGLLLIEGIADYDQEGAFGMPKTDVDAVIKDVDWHRRPDYGGSLWSPDGVDRDRARFARGLDVVKSNPGWFLAVMFKRAGFMLRYNDGLRLPWPMYTAKVPIILAEPPFGSVHSIEGREPEWGMSGIDLLTAGHAISRGVRITPDERSRSLRIEGDDSEFGNQFGAGPLAVRPHSDYVMAVRARLDRGSIAAKVTDSGSRITLGSVGLPEMRRRRGHEDSSADDQPSGSSAEERMETVQAPFATGERNEVQILFSNDGVGSSEARLNDLALYRFGRTPFEWTRYPRLVIRAFQKNLFVTARMWTLIAMGATLLAFAGRGRSLVLFLVVPLYFLCTQSTLHTEYRYVLAIHYFLFALAAMTLWFAGKIVARFVRILLRSGLDKKSA